MWSSLGQLGAVRRPFAPSGRDCGGAAEDWGWLDGGLVGHDGLCDRSRHRCGGSDRVDFDHTGDFVAHVLGDRLGGVHGVVDSVELCVTLGGGASGGGEAEAVEAHVVAAGGDHEVDQVARVVGAVDGDAERVFVAEALRLPTAIGPGELFNESDRGSLQAVLGDAGRRARRRLGRRRCAGGVDAVGDGLDGFVARRDCVEDAAPQDADREAGDGAVVGDGSGGGALDGEGGELRLLGGRFGDEDGLRVLCSDAEQARRSRGRQRGR